MSADTPDTAETLARKLVETFWREYVSAYPWANAEGVQRVKTALTDEIAYRLREREQEVARLKEELRVARLYAALDMSKIATLEKARDKWKEAATGRSAAESALAEVGKVAAKEAESWEHLDGQHQAAQAVVAAIRAFLARPEGKPARCNIRVGGEGGLACGNPEPCADHAPAPAVEGPHHVCGLSGFDPFKGDTCPACSAIHAPEPATEPPNDMPDLWDEPGEAATEYSIVDEERAKRTSYAEIMGPYTRIIVDCREDFGDALRLAQRILNLLQPTRRATPERAPARTTCADCGNVLTVGERATGLCVHCAPDPVAAPAKEEFYRGPIGPADRPRRKVEWNEDGTIKLPAPPPTTETPREEGE